MKKKRDLFNNYFFAYRFAINHSRYKINARRHLQLHFCFLIRGYRRFFYFFTEYVSDREGNILFGGG